MKVITVIGDFIFSLSDILISELEGARVPTILSKGVKIRCGREEFVE